MEQERIARVRELLFEFMPLFHRRISSVFHDRGEYNCTKNQNKALFIMKQRGTVNPGTLGGCLDMQKGSLTSLVDDLVRMGLVHREIDPEDRRRQRLSLTARGERYVADRYRKAEERLAELFEGLPPERFGRFVGLMEELIELMRGL